MNLCLSGGAIGSDREWGMAAKNAGHSVIHWIFDEFKIKDLEDYTVLTQKELNEADMYLKQANKSMKRSWPTRSGYINNLLRRNYFQINSSSSVYAVSSFKKDKSLLNISGGTAWACQLYVDKCSSIDECKLYLFNQSDNHWYQWLNHWDKIYSPPKPEGVYAGIGTREISDFGKLAIKLLYQG